MLVARWFDESVAHRRCSCDRLRKMMLEELQRSNYAEITTGHYIRAVKIAVQLRRQVGYSDYPRITGDSEVTPLRDNRITAAVVYRPAHWIDRPIGSVGARCGPGCAGILVFRGRLVLFCLLCGGCLQAQGKHSRQAEFPFPFRSRGSERVPRWADR